MRRFAIPGALLLGFLIGFVLLSFFAVRFQGGPIPQPQSAPAVQVPNCNVPGDASNISGIGAGVTGGVFRAPQITIPQGTSLRLNRTLILVADNLLQVDGDIIATHHFLMGRPIDIVLVSLQGDVVIGANAEIGTSFLNPESAPDGANDNKVSVHARAAGRPAKSAGFIKIIAQQGSINIQGSVIAQAGGEGGSAVARGTSATGQVPVIGGFMGGSAGAAGSQGGHGGHVQLCALDSINIASNAVVIGGMGGGGGIATAKAVNGSDAEAIGGPSGDAGDVRIDGLNPNCQVFNNGIIRGGSVQFGNLATANGGPPGGKATATGGDAGSGGTVIINNCAFVPPPGNVAAYKGGGGGPAKATGGNGAAGGLFSGSNGGNAKARGGDGGVSGVRPVIPLTTGGTAPGQLINPAPIGMMGLAHGKGGDATAKAGNGGVGGRYRGGGNSGTEDALGGTGSGGTAAAPATAPSAAGTPGAGGAGGATPLPGGSVSTGTP